MFYELEKHNRNMIKNETEDLHTTLIGKLYDVDNAKRKASVKFLQKTLRTLKNDVIQTIPPDIIEVPLLPLFSSDNFEIYIPYSNDDKVLVSILERPYVEALQNNEISEQQSFGRMELGYAVVVKSLPKDLMSGSQHNNTKIVINNKKDGTTITLGNDIQITGNTILNGNLSINGNVSVSGEIKAKSVDTESGVSKSNVPYTHP